MEIDYSLLTLPREIRTQEIIPHLFELKDKSVESITDSYKIYLKLPRPNRQLEDELSSAYNKFLFKNLTAKDYKNLNQYIVDSLYHNLVPKDFSLLVKLLIWLNKLDSAITHQYGSTPLVCATIYGRKEIAKLLIKAGSNVGNADLMLASREGQKEIVELLINAGADVNAVDKYGNTALMWADYKGHKEITELLKKHGAIK